MGNIYNNLPIMMFFLLPIFAALILKILYLRRRYYYSAYCIMTIPYNPNHSVRIEITLYNPSGIFLDLLKDQNIIIPLVPNMIRL